MLFLVRNLLRYRNREFVLYPQYGIVILVRLVMGLVNRIWYDNCEICEVSDISVFGITNHVNLFYTSFFRIYFLFSNRI